MTSALARLVFAVFNLLSRCSSNKSESHHPLMPFAPRSENTCSHVPVRRRLPKQSSPPGRPYHGVSRPFDALSNKQRPTPRLPRPGCAAPSGFLNLLALCSAHCPPSPISCRWRPWAFTYRGLLLDRSEHHLPMMRYPPCRIPIRVLELSSPRLRGFGATAESVALRRFYPRPQSPCPSWCCPLRGITPVGSRPLALPSGLLSWASIERRRAETRCRSTCSSKCQRTGEVGPLFPGNLPSVRSLIHTHS